MPRRFCVHRLTGSTDEFTVAEWAAICRWRYRNEPLRKLFGWQPTITRTKAWPPQRRFVRQLGRWRHCAPANASDVTSSTARDARLARLEAVLFVGREPISSRRLAHFAGLLDGTEARTLVRRLNRLYDDEGRAFRVEEIAGGFQLMTRPKFGPWLRRLFSAPVEMRLSAPAMETLAVVAYRQPVLRASVDAIRGVDCGEILRQLMERDLVRIAGRSDDLGRPYLYGTTRKFLQIFGLRHLDDLPRADILRLSSVPENSTEIAANPNLDLPTTSPEVTEEEIEESATSRR